MAHLLLLQNSTPKFLQSNHLKKLHTLYVRVKKWDQSKKIIVAFREENCFRFSVTTQLCAHDMVAMMMMRVIKQKMVKLILELRYFWMEIK